MYKVFVLLCVSLFLSCDFFKQEVEPNAIARVNNVYLYQEDIKHLVPQNISKADSTVIVKNYITRWATQQLLIDQAILNLSQEKVDEYEVLVANYKHDLYTKAYKDAVVSKLLDSVIDQEELEAFYIKNKKNFLLNEVLVKLRYIHISQDHNSFKEIEKQFTRFDFTDKEVLSQKSIEFLSYYLNDSVWVKADLLVDKILPLNNTNKNQVLKKSNYTRLHDSLGVYLVKINDVLRSNQYAPLEYVLPTVEQIILNKRKLELVKKLERDITKDAIKNNKFEEYN